MQAQSVDTGRTIPYRAAEDKNGGDVVVQNGMVGVVANDIDISEDDLGSLIVEGVFDFAAESGHVAISVGDDIYWDDDGNPQGGTAGSGCATTTDTGVYLGKAIPDSAYSAGGDAAAAESATVRVLMALAPEGNTESS